VFDYPWRSAYSHSSVLRVFARLFLQNSMYQHHLKLCRNLQYERVPIGEWFEAHALLAAVLKTPHFAHIMYLCVSHNSHPKQIFTLILRVYRAIYIHKQVLLPTNCTTNSTYPHTHTHTHAHTHRRILQHASAINYGHLLGSVIYK